MEKKAVDEPLNSDESDRKENHTPRLNIRIPRETYPGFDLLPEHLRQLIGDYFSDDKRNRTKISLIWKPNVTLCLLQDIKFDFCSSWYFGCLSPEEKWELSLEGIAAQQYHIKDYQSCLDLLSRQNSPYCPIVMKTLVCQLNLTSKDFSSALDDLQNTLTKLQEHVNSLQRVIFAMENHAFCCFSFKDTIDDAARHGQTVDRLLALKQIIDDFRSCWKISQSSMELLNHYILSDVKPVSDIYLSQFVIFCSQMFNGDMLDAVAPNMNSSKLKLIYYLESPYALKNFDQRVARRCHVFHLDTSKIYGWSNFNDGFPPAYGFEDSPFIERIIIDALILGHVLKLPRPSPPVTDTTLRSALIEITLNGPNYILPLTDLNSGYFPHLARLSVTDGHITGHLDSQSVPCLKMLILEPGSKHDRYFSEVGPLVQEHVKSLISADRPWQLAATEKRGGWSLSSYDEPTSNPHEDVRESSLHSSQSLPLIRELLLVARFKESGYEWKSQLNGDLPLEMAAGDHSSRRLVWGPECVQKITAYCTTGSGLQLDFNEVIPGQPRILSSVMCHRFSVYSDGVALPNLQSLQVNHSFVKLSGIFPRLQTLFFHHAFTYLPWQFDAPMLQTFHSDRGKLSDCLLLHPQLLPLLSSLHITPLEDEYINCPRIFFDEDDLGLSRVNHLMFGKGMTLAPYFEQCQVNRVSHLELAVDAFQLPVCWRIAEWLCETLIVNAHGRTPDSLQPSEPPDRVVLPLLPRLKKLTITEKDCHVLLDSEMPELTDCTVPSPRSLGPHLKCSKLRCIYFTDPLSESDKETCFSPATYEAIGAHPEWVYFCDSGEVKRMFWNMVPSAAGESSVARPLEDGGSFFVSREQIASSFSSSSSSAND